MGTLKFIDIARLTKIPVRTLYQMRDDGRFPLKPIAGTKLYRTEDVEAWRNSTAVGE